MAVDPNKVLSPRKRLKDLRVVHRDEDWSLAVGIWDKMRALLTRWNGDEDRPLGNPVSHAHPTWFVLPQHFHAPLLGLVPSLEADTAVQWLQGINPTLWEDRG